jgi:hypothetical protein
MLSAESSGGLSPEPMMRRTGACRDWRQLDLTQFVLKHESLMKALAAHCSCTRPSMRRLSAGAFSSAG